jgi:hypothetical protein
MYVDADLDARGGGGEGYSASRLRLYTPRKCPGTHRIGGWVVHRTGLDAIEKKNLAPAEKETPVVEHAARSYTD